MAELATPLPPSLPTQRNKPQLSPATDHQVTLTNLRIAELGIIKLWQIVDNLSEIYDFKLTLSREDYSVQDLRKALWAITRDPEVRTRVNRIIDQV